MLTGQYTPRSLRRSQEFQCVSRVSVAESVTPRTACHMLPAGTRIGSYEVVSPLGAGGMGEVYRARDTRLGREVAVKVISDAASHDADRIARFQSEAQLLAALNHP